jgi:hypothetical protein
MIRNDRRIFDRYENQETKSWIHIKVKKETRTAKKLHLGFISTDI